LFTDISFSEREIIQVLSKAGKQLSVTTDYKILNKLEENSTIEDLATQLWKYVCRVVKNN
jgi:Fe2+ or Zn2+ uptake regulation protein